MKTPETKMAIVDRFLTLRRKLKVSVDKLEMSERLLKHMRKPAAREKMGHVLVMRKLVIQLRRMALNAPPKA